MSGAFFNSPRWRVQRRGRLRFSLEARQIVVANADHGIADEAPDVVIDAVHSVVDQIRAEVKR